MAVGPSTERQLKRLCIWNVTVGLMLAVQAVLLALLTNDFSLSVNATFMTEVPGAPSSLHHLFNRPSGWGVLSRPRGGLAAGELVRHRRLPALRCHPVPRRTKCPA